MSTKRERTSFALFMVLILVVMPAYLYYGYVTRPVSAPWSTIGELQIKGTSVHVTGLALGGPDLSFAAVVYNPNGFGVSLNSANYSIYANGHYLQSGHITTKYELAPKSTQTFVFPFSTGWTSAFETLGSYIWDWGNENWEVRGTASIEVSDFPLAVPFDLAIHTS